MKLTSSFIPKFFSQIHYIFFHQGGHKAIARALWVKAKPLEHKKRSSIHSDSASASSYESSYSGSEIGSDSESSSDASRGEGSDTFGSDAHQKGHDRNRRDRDLDRGDRDRDRKAVVEKEAPSFSLSTFLFGPTVDSTAASVKQKFKKKKDMVKDGAPEQESKGGRHLNRNSTHEREESATIDLATFLQTSEGGEEVTHDSSKATTSNGDHQGEHLGDSVPSEISLNNELSSSVAQTATSDTSSASALQPPPSSSSQSSSSMQNERCEETNLPSTPKKDMRAMPTKTAQEDWTAGVRASAAGADCFARLAQDAEATTTLIQVYA